MIFISNNDFSTPQPQQTDRPAQVSSANPYGTAASGNIQYLGYGNGYHMQGQGNPYTKAFNLPSTQASYMPPPHQ